MQGLARHIWRHKLSTTAPIFRHVHRNMSLLNVRTVGEMNREAPGTTISMLGAAIVVGLVVTVRTVNGCPDVQSPTMCEDGNNNNKKDSSTFRLFSALEAKEELEKVRLAQIIHDLHMLATGEKAKGGTSNGRLRRHVTMVVNRKPTVQRLCHNEIHPDIGNQISLDGVDLFQLSPEDTKHLVEGVATGSKFQVSSLQRLLSSATSLLKQEPNLIDISERKEPVTVVGDLHGSLESLTHILQKVDLQNHLIVFDGDFVDRGEKSLEVLVTLLVLKLAYPDRVYLIRGNHEDSMVASVYGFRDEICKKYGMTATNEIWRSMECLFSALPIAVRTKSALILHGGLPSADFDLQHLRDLPKEKRFEMKSIVNPVTPEEQFLAGIVWSDPTDDETQDVAENPRGIGILFGCQVAQEFLKRNNLQYLVRGHQMVESGVTDMQCGEDRSVITIFSAAAYPASTGTNEGAIIHLYPDGSQQHETYTMNDISVSNDQLIEETTKEALAKVRVMISHKKSQLEKAFAEVQQAGRVTIEQVSLETMGIFAAGVPFRLLTECTQ